MESPLNDTNSNTVGFGDKRSGEARVFSQKMFSNPLEVNGGLKIYVDDDLTSLKNASESQDTPLVFRNTFGKMESSSSHGLPNSDAASGLDMIFTSSRSAATEPKEEGKDLINLDLPWDIVVNGSDQIARDSNNSRHVNPVGSDVVNARRTAERSIFDADRGYTSDNTDLGQTKHHNSSIQNGTTVKNTNRKINEVPTQNVKHKHSSNSKITSNTDQHLGKEPKNSDQNLTQTTKNISGNDLNYNMSNFSSSPLSRHSESDGRQLENKMTHQRVRTTSHPGNSKFSRSKSKTGVLSDDEYIVNNSAVHHGRRSAPIFTKRVFSASEFWNSGQTAIERSHLQDIANARNQERQKAKLHEGKSIRTPRLQRPHSVDPDSFLNEVKNDYVNKQSIQSGNNSQKRNRRRLVTYGSTDNAGKGVEHRGYVSENEAGDLRLLDNQRLPGKDGFEPDGNLVWNIDFGGKAGLRDDNDAFENPTQDAVRTRGMKGVFRIPRTISPRVLQVKMTHGQDVAILSNKPYGYISENDAAEFKKQLITQDSDDDTIDEDSNENSDDKMSLEKSSDDLYDSKQEVKSEVHTEVYKRRWYLLFLFSITAMLWNAIWSTWGPIAQSAKAVFNWDDGDIAMFTYLGNIPFLVTMFPCAYLMDVSGMRLAMIFCCGFMFLGSGFRCIPGDLTTSTWLIRTGQLLNGIAGTIPSSGPALLSGLWFPPNQRATATAVSTVAGYMGASISFVIGPLLVPEPNNLVPISDNDTDNLLRYEDYPNNNSNSNTTTYDAQELGIKQILYGEFGLAALLLVLVLLYFPSKPPLPPSISASIPREKYLNGLKLLVRNKQFWICAVAFSVPIGVYESWQVILDINLDSKGISQQTAGWLDFYATVGGCVSGLLVSRFADLFIRQMKLFLLVFYSFATLAVLWFTLVVLEIIPFDTVSIYAAIIIAGVFLDGGSPLFFELTIEVSYPVGEGVTSGFTHMMCAAAGTVFLIIVEIDNIGTEWMNWCFLGVVAMTIPLLMFINTAYARADIDDMEIDISEDEEALTSISASDADEKTSLLKNSSV